MAAFMSICHPVIGHKLIMVLPLFFIQKPFWIIMLSVRSSKINNRLFDPKKHTQRKAEGQTCIDNLANTLVVMCIVCVFRSQRKDISLCMACKVPIVSLPPACQGTGPQGAATIPATEMWCNDDSIAVTSSPSQADRDCHLEWSNSQGEHCHQFFFDNDSRDPSPPMEGIKLCLGYGS
jgi:hypothetical protein